MYQPDTVPDHRALWPDRPSAMLITVLCLCAYFRAPTFTTTRGSWGSPGETVATETKGGGRGEAHHRLPQCPSLYDKDLHSPAAKWYKGMKQKMVRLIFERKIYMDEPLDNSANEIYLEHVCDISEAYSRGGDGMAKEGRAANRKLAIKTLWRAGGRGGEPAAVAYSGIKWNLLHGCACLECPQPKSSKLLVHTPCSDAHTCH